MALTLKELVNNYQAEHPDVFTFKITDEKVYITAYHDSETRTELQIPDFVYGVLPNGGAVEEDRVAGPFANASHLRRIALGKGMRSLSYFFAGTTLESLDLSDWDVSQCTDFSYLFYESALTSVGDLSNWDVSQGTDFSAMFAWSELKNIGDLSCWNVANCSDFSGMFFNTVLEPSTIGDLSGWNVANATCLASMFCESNLTSVGDLSRWNVANCTNFSFMFAAARLTDVGNLSNWNVAKGTDFASMLHKEQLASVGDLSQWNVASTARIYCMEDVFRKR